MTVVINTSYLLDNTKSLKIVKSNTLLPLNGIASVS